MLKSLTEQQWHEDIQYLGDKLPEKHANAFHFTSEAEFRGELSRLAENAVNLTEQQIIAHLARIVNSIGDGHTFLEFPDSFMSYPLEFMRFGDDFRLVGTISAYQQVLGMRLIGIEGHSISDLLSAIYPWVSQGESSTRVYWSQEQLLSKATLLHAIGLTRSEQSSCFTFLDDMGNEHLLTIETGHSNDDRVFVYGDQTPLFRQRIEEPVWLTRLDNSVLYFNFVRYPDGLEMLQKGYEVIDELTRSGATKLIIDFRRNGGGNFVIGDYGLIRLLSVSRVLPVQVYALIGRTTFSAGMVNAIHAREMLNAHLVGEPTGAKPNHYQELEFLTLPNSGLEIGCSIRYYHFQEHDTDGVQPDTFIEQSWDDFRVGRDNIVEWCREQ